MPAIELVIRRKDISVSYRGLPLSEIEIYHVALTMQDVTIVNRVRFVDDDGKERVLKNGYGFDQRFQWITVERPEDLSHKGILRWLDDLRQQRYQYDPL